MITDSRDLRLAALNALSAVAGLMNTMSVALFTNNIVPTETTPLASYTQCELGGMETQTGITAGTAYVDADGTVVKPVAVTPFSALELPEEPLFIYGWVSFKGTTVISFERFDEPVVIAALGDGLEIDPAAVFPK